MGFIDKALGKAAASVASAAAKAASSATKKAAARVTVKPKVTPRPKAQLPAVRPSTVTPSAPVVRSTAPTRSTFSEAATPRTVPSTRVIRAEATPSPRLAIEAPKPRLAIEPPPRLSASRDVELYRPAGLPAVRTAPTAPSFTQAAGVTPTSGMSSRYMNLTDEELAAQNLADNRIVNAARVAPQAPAASAVDEAVSAAEATRKAAPRFLRPALETAGTLAPVYAESGYGEDLPGWAKTALNVGGLLAGGSLAARGLRGKTSFLNPAVREAYKEAPGFLAKTKFTIPKLVAPAAGALTLKSIGSPFGSTAPEATAAVALPAETEAPSALPPLGGAEDVIATGPSPEQEVQAAINSALSSLETGAGTKSDADTVATGQQAILDNAVSSAMAELEAAYGGAEGVNAAMAAGDPILAQQLAGIDADYQAGMLQIQANYAGALGQVAGYQAQADALLKDVAAQQMSGFAAAAGGLEAMSPGVGLTGSQAAAAGVSDTALGGAGITGAALARGLAGASSAQAAADRLRLGTDLSGQLATGRLTQADLESGLARAAAGEKAAARTDAAQREAEARALDKAQKREDAIRIAELKYQAALDKQAEEVRKEENAAARKQRIAELKMNAELDLAMKVAAMTPEERRAYQGSAAGKKKFTSPSWYGKSLSGDAAAAVAVPGHSGGKVTAGEIQNAYDYLDAALQDPNATDPETAFKYWANVYAELDTDTLAMLRLGKRPVTANAMVKTLFGTPAK